MRGVWRGATRRTDGSQQIRVGVVAWVGFVVTVFGANWAIERFGVVPVGFGLSAPAGVYFVGVAFTLRDVVQRALGKQAAIAAIGLGAACSALVSPTFALASAVAFLFSELADLAVYTPLSRRRFWFAVAASNLVGAVVDSGLFLWLAFWSLEFLPGQVLGKLWMTALAAPLLLAWRSRQVRTALDA